MVTQISPHGPMAVLHVPTSRALRSVQIDTLLDSLTETREGQYVRVFRGVCCRASAQGKRKCSALGCGRPAVGAATP